MPDSTSSDQSPGNLEQQNTREIGNQSGGVSIDADSVQVGADVVGRDKIESAGIHIDNAQRVHISFDRVATSMTQEEHIAREKPVRLSKNKTAAIMLFVALLVILGIVFILTRPHPDSSISSDYVKVGDSQVQLLYPLECQDLWDNSSIEVRWKVSTDSSGQTQFAVLDTGNPPLDLMTVTLGTMEYSASFKEVLDRGPFGLHKWHVVINEVSGPEWEFHLKRFPEPATTCPCRKFECFTP